MIFIVTSGSEHSEVFVAFYNKDICASMHKPRNYVYVLLLLYQMLLWCQKEEMIFRCECYNFVVVTCIKSWGVTIVTYGYKTLPSFMYIICRCYELMGGLNYFALVCYTEFLSSFLLLKMRNLLCQKRA